MWVASYGVMPQTYIRAVGPGVRGRTTPEAVSKTWTGWPVPGTAGRNGVGQKITAELYGGRSERRPRDGRPLPGGDGVGPAVEQPAAAAEERSDLAQGEEGVELGTQRRLLVLDLLDHGRDPGEVGVGDRLPREAPEHRTQLGLLVQAHAVVEAAQPPGLAHQVGALAVGVVDEGVESGDGPGRRGVLVDDDDGLAQLVLAAQDGQPARRDVPRADEVHRVLRLVAGVTHPALDRADAVRPGAQHRRRHDVEPPGCADEVGRDLAPGEGAVGEVPQRPLPHHRLVYREGTALAGADEHREVGSVSDPPEDLEVLAS